MALTQEILKQELEYNQETGEFKRLKHRGNQSSGVIVPASLDTNGYRQIRVFDGIESKKYRAHRLAFLYMTGSFPEHEIDHLNGIRHDNRWENLREVTKELNQRNRAIQSNSPSGILGVVWDKSQFKWRVTFKSKYYGSFDLFWDAVALRKRLEAEDGTFEENHSSTKNIDFI